MEASLLVEILTEELPPKSLKVLSESFSRTLTEDLREEGLLAKGSTSRAYATPRRLAVLVSHVLDKAPDHPITQRGPSIKSGLGADGKPTPALVGFATKVKARIEDLIQVDTTKGKVFAYEQMAAGTHLETNLDLKVEEALRKLPIAKTMRWGNGDAQFVRPMHGLVLLHGDRVLPGKVLGVESSNRTRGHRFLGKGEIVLKRAEDYEATLREDGKVIADFAARRAEIERQLEAEAVRQKATLGTYEDLLDEVTALVEQPSVYVGGFEASFLEVPPECLILTMRQNQKYFPLFDTAGKLLPKFLIVSNMQVADPRHIIGGNERVVRPRLEDARFFYNQDRKQKLESRVDLLAKVVYHNKLGSQLDRVKRIQVLAVSIARKLDADAASAERAAWLCKADLVTGMVGEFPELQGTMGRYYALHDGEKKEVADAIAAHYKPRFAGDTLPQGGVACALALADKLDAMAGLFGIGQAPTGDKDPFGLRRAALGVVRILVENKLPLRLPDLAAPELAAFILERFASYLKEQGFSTLQVDAVLSLNPAELRLVPQQLEAVKAFQALPEAESLAAANKRVANILRQAEAKGEKFADARASELKEPAERALLDAIRSASEKANPLFSKGDYTGYLKTFSVLKAPVDAFFDKVMVMVDDEQLRRGRLALLRDLREAMNRVADISKLAV